MRASWAARSKNPGTTWTPSITMLVPSAAARLISASMPTETAAVCSRKPATSASERRVGSRTTVSVWNDETWSVGISSAESIERITSRIDPSVATTRTMPSRCARCVAIVDFPTPVAPPIRITSGTSSRSTSCHRPKLVAYRSPASSWMTMSARSESSELATEDRPASSSRSSIVSATS